MLLVWWQKTAKLPKQVTYLTATAKSCRLKTLQISRLIGLL